MTIDKDHSLLYHRQSEQSQNMRMTFDVNEVEVKIEEMVDCSRESYRSSYNDKNYSA